MSNFWKDITSHKGNGWWNLPETTQSEIDPKNEGPISIPWLKKIWNIISHGNVEHAGPAFYTVVACLLYTSDAADASLRVDLGGRRII